MPSLKELAQGAFEKILLVLAKRKIQKIAGTIVFRKTNSDIKFLLLQHKDSHWDFPKGKVDQNESIDKAARRELFEETGLKNVRLKYNFIETISYSAQKKNGKIIKKIAFFYLGKAVKKKIILSDEHKDYIWANYRKSLQLLSFNSSKRMLKKTQKFIKQNYKK